MATGLPGIKCVSSVPCNDYSCRLQPVISKLRFFGSQAEPLFLWKSCMVCQRACVTSYVVVTRDVFREVMFKLTLAILIGEGTTSFWVSDAILSWEGKLGKAVTMLLVLLNCGMLVVDSVTLLCILSACFSLSSAFAFVPKLLLLPREKKHFASQLSLPLIICNHHVLDFFFLILFTVLYMVLMCF